MKLDELKFYASVPHDHWSAYDDGYLKGVEEARKEYTERTSDGFILWHRDRMMRINRVADPDEAQQGYSDALKRIGEMIVNGSL